MRFSFFTILYFDESCRTRCFKFLNSVFDKNLKMDSSFFRLFIYFFKKNSNLTGWFEKTDEAIADRFLQFWERECFTCDGIFCDWTSSVYCLVTWMVIFFVNHRLLIARMCWSDDRYVLQRFYYLGNFVLHQPSKS
jgi:hypothetical protein